MVQGNKESEKGYEPENKAELFSLLGKKLLMFPTFGVLIFCFYLYWNDYTFQSYSWLIWSIGIMWFVVLFGDSLSKLIDEHISPSLLSRVIAFIRSGEPKGLNFEVLMSYISNLTINGLVMALALYVYKSCGVYFAMLIWLSAMYIMLITIYNFLYNAEFNPNSKISAILFAALSLFSFFIPFILATY